MYKRDYHREFFEVDLGQINRPTKMRAILKEKQRQMLLGTAARFMENNKSEGSVTVI